MSLPLLALVVMAALALGYSLYGRFIARQFRLDDAVPTPAVRMKDGVDYDPTPPFYLLGQHFSAIAAAGPIAGPILACQGFGWLPCVLWITVGVIFIGAVHDFSSLIASVRHNARSVAEIVKENVGPRAWVALLIFIWLALVYVIIAFTDVTAGTFIGETEIRGEVSFNKGGAVAAASTMYLLLAVAMGLIQKKWRPPLWLMTLVFVPATLGVVWFGTKISTVLLAGHMTWSMIILGYCFVASLLPVWLLLQPRGYLGGFVLYMALAVGVFGILFGGFEIRQPATLPEKPLFGMAGSVFPFLFVTIACGACSGFHGLVCSGTTSKQISRETHCKPVGYGGMLLEAFVALIALATIMIVAPRAKYAPPGTIYGDGIATFLTVLIGKGAFTFAATFGAMAFSTFVFDTIDVATRLGRYIVQELSGAAGRTGAMVATGATVAVPALILLGAGKGSYLTFWHLFGTSNQLLAGLTLLGISVWLRKNGKACWFTVLPMLFVMTITLWALSAQVIAFFGKVKDPVTRAFQMTPFWNGLVGSLLILLAGYLVVESSRALLKPRRAT